MIRLYLVNESSLSHELSRCRRKSPSIWAKKSKRSKIGNKYWCLSRERCIFTLWNENTNDHNFKRNGFDQCHCSFFCSINHYFTIVLQASVLQVKALTSFTVWTKCSLFPRVQRSYHYVGGGQRRGAAFNTVISEREGPWFGRDKERLGELMWVICSADFFPKLVL